MSKIKLILVDDELTSRNTIKNFLMNNKEYEIVADFSDGKSALDWLRKMRLIYCFVIYRCRR